jgi:hypothetical protein
LQGWRNLTRKQKTLVYDLERIYRDYITRPHEEKDNYKPTVRKLRGILADIEQALASGENREKLQRAIAEMDAVSYGPAMEVQKVEEYIKRWTESTLDALQYEEK